MSAPKMKPHKTGSVTVDMLDELERKARLLSELSDCTPQRKARALVQYRTIRSELTESHSTEPRKMHLIISHIPSADITMGSLVTIIDQVDNAPDLENRKGGKLMRASRRAAQSAIDEIMRLGITDNHPLAKLVAKAMQAVDLALRAEIEENRNKHPGRQDGGKSTGAKSTKKAKERTDKELQQAAEAAIRLEDKGAAAVTLEDISKESGVLLKRLRNNIGKAAIDKVAFNLRKSRASKS